MNRAERAEARGRAPGRDARSFAHEALFYANDDDFLAGTVPFMSDGAARGEAVIAIVPEPRLRLLQGAIGPTGEAVTFMDMRTVGRNPARIIPTWRDFIDRHGASGRPVRGITEPIWAGRSPDEIQECQIHESLLNEAFKDAGDVSILCLYNHAALDDSVGTGARQDHQWLRHGTRRERTRGPVGDPASVYSGLLAPAPPDAHVETFGALDLHRLRHYVAAFAGEAGLSPDRARDLVLATSEIAANSIRHGGGSGTLATWRDGDRAVCELSDAGRITDPLVGRRRPGTDQDGGRGLWLANQLCDLVQIRVGPSGTVVRLHEDRGPA